MFNELRERRDRVEQLERENYDLKARVTELEGVNVNPDINLRIELNELRRDCDQNQKDKDTLLLGHDQLKQRVKDLELIVLQLKDISETSRSILTKHSRVCDKL